jgi:GT2 family glycosyltransferase
MMVTDQAVTVGVVNYDGARHLPLSLEAIARLGNSVAEILLVDNGSTDQGVAFVRSAFPNVRVIELGENRGPGVARNVLIREAAHDRVLLLDNDVAPQLGSVELLVGALNANPRAVAAMPAILYLSAPGVVQYAGAMSHFLGVSALVQADTPVSQLDAAVRPVGSLVTACVMVDRKRFGERSSPVHLPGGSRAGASHVSPGLRCPERAVGEVSSRRRNRRLVRPADRYVHAHPGALYDPQPLAHHPDAL